MSQFRSANYANYFQSKCAGEVARASSNATATAAAGTAGIRRRCMNATDWFADGSAGVFSCGFTLEDPDLVTLHYFSSIPNLCTSANHHNVTLCKPPSP